MIGPQVRADLAAGLPGPGRLDLSTDDPSALAVKEANIGTMTRRKGPGSRKIAGIALTPEDKLWAIIHLMGNGSPE